MQVFVTGGSGFVGTALCRGLLADGHSVTVLTRDARAKEHLPKGAGICLGNPTEPGAWQDEASGSQGFVNLAGASIFGRWTPEHKEAIKNSRVLATRHLAQALARGKDPEQKVLVSASAVGFYGFRQDEELDETSEGGDDFLARVCREWEAEARQASETGARVVTARFGIVLDRSGGALAKMLPPFRMGLGGPLGSGKQWFSWITLRDLVGAALYCLTHPEMRGPVNFTAPEPVTNKALARALGAKLKRPALFPVPGFTVRMALGELGSVLLEGQKVLPKKLLYSGFRFQCPSLKQALDAVLG